MEENELFFEDLKVWLEETGFTLDSFIADGRNEMVKTYYFVKDKYKFKIRLNYDILYNTNSSIMVDLIDCEGEIYSPIGWVGRKYLITLKKPFSITFFNEICNHYEI